MRYDKSKLNIGAYVLQPYARTEKHIKEIKECGIDMIIDLDYDLKTLDLFSKYNLGAIVRGATPNWWGGNGEAGKLSQINPLDLYDKCAKKFVDHPAIWGISIGDEPSALDIPYYGIVLNKVQGLFPNSFPYLNLYPNYATVAENTQDETVSQLGTRTYDEYIDVYSKNVPADYISYDYYVYATKNLAGCLLNYRIVTEAARKTGRRFMYIAQVNSSNPAEFTTVNQLRFQAFSAMSFGAMDISWGCYTAGWWHHNVLDEKGEKTEQYEKLKLVNHEIKNLAPEYMKFRNTNTLLVCFCDEISKESGLENTYSFSNGYFIDVKSSNALIIGEMTSLDGSDKKALFITVADDYMDKEPKKSEIVFKSQKKISLFSKDGKAEIDCCANEYRFTASSNEGFLIVAE